MHAAAVTSVLSLAGLPILFLAYGNLIAAGLWENLLQAVVQGIFAGAGCDLSVHPRRYVAGRRARRALSRRWCRHSRCLIGFLTIGEVPSLSQLIGLAVVVIGFRLTQTG